MVDQLSSFAAEVTRVAREVGTEGKLGGQAEVAGRLGHLARPDPERQPARRQPHHPGARDRRGVHRRDPGRPHPVDHRRRPGRGGGAQGQHQPDDRQPARDHRENAQQDWLKSNLARICGLMQGQRDLDEVRQLIMSELTPVVDGPARRVLPRRAARRPTTRAAADRQLRLQAPPRRAVASRSGEALVGQAALEKRPIRCADGAGRLPAGRLRASAQRRRPT